MDRAEELTSLRQNRLFFYSPYCFIPTIERSTHLKIVSDRIASFVNKVRENVYSVEITVNHAPFLFLVEFLEWDTDYFHLRTFKLFTAVYDEQQPFEDITEAARQFNIILTNELHSEYCFIEIPSEDIRLIQALTLNGFKLIETRLTYFRGDLDKHAHERFGVRPATKADIENLKRVARVMRNDYDRFHADTIFSTKIADEFLATYVEAAVNGFSDIVLVPNQEGSASDAFLTALYYKTQWASLGENVSKMVLSAVSSSTCKGWYIKLISEMTYHLRDEGAKYVFMNTQSTNRAVFRTWEKLGYRLGLSTHVLAFATTDRK